MPPGFHASVVAEGLGPVRHLAVRDNGDLYISTLKDKQGAGGGIIALHQDTHHKADQVMRFGAVDGGTGIRFHRGALYAASATAIYRFTFEGKALIPGGEPQVIVDGMPQAVPGFGLTNRLIAFDGQDGLFVGLNGGGNICTDPDAPKDAPPVGLKPCPLLEGRGGVWRFKADKAGQRFPEDGEQLATGIRDITAFDWSPADGHLYAIMHGRDGTHKAWPNLLSEADDANIADEMHRITSGTDFGWPYTYYDGVRKVRLVSPEYGGDGKATPASGNYSKPVLTFESRRPAPVDLMFYTGHQFPSNYRGGAFIALHGTGADSGYDIVFVPFSRDGKSGEPSVFASGFAGAGNTAPSTARYRPMGEALGPDGSLYVADSQKGRIWRITYQR